MTPGAVVVQPREGQNPDLGGDHDMTSEPTGTELLGTVQPEADGTGTVRMEHRFDTASDDVWAALTDPARLAIWIGDVEGELRLGGEFRRHFFASGSQGMGRVQACDPRRRLVVTLDPGEPSEAVIEIVIAADGDGTRLVWEQRGVPLAKLAAYGAGTQIHVEDLASHLAGRGPGDADARWDGLQSAYEVLLGAPGAQRS
jgi:uncharacterized protein YndB with AHSA1/START domain